MNTVPSGDGTSIAFERFGKGPPVVLVGGASPEWMIDVGRQTSDGLPNGRLGVLEGQEHVVSPEILAPLLTEFSTTGVD
jgi:hypothetical protein